MDIKKKLLVLSVLINHSRISSIQRFFEQTIADLILLDDVIESENVNKNIINLATLKYFYLFTETERKEMLKKSNANTTDLDLRKIICKYCFKLLSSDADLVEDLSRFFLCTAYNTLATIVSHTQTNLLQYQVFFKLNMWTKMFDCNTTYSLPQEFEKIPSLRKKVGR